jgi:hypothetical protein
VETVETSETEKPSALKAKSLQLKKVALENHEPRKVSLFATLVAIE